ncbi:MAG: PQQ-binding-like beta-propeller repeat protein [Armatimonadetes bacterium]|nr:PQQ-binding-like beta-propeller repeat protein [Armatimonadota bacterium]
MRKSIVAFAVFAAMCVSGTLTAADWPQFKGPSANGFAPDTGINKNWTKTPPKVLWTTPMNDDGYAGVSVGGGKVFVINHEGSKDILRAIDIATGKDAWTYTYEDTDKANRGFARSTPIFDLGNVYSLSRLGILNCLKVKTGKLIWSRDICKDFNGKRPGWDYAYSPLIDKNKLIVMPGGPDAGVVALDKKTGKTVIWQGGSNVSSYATPVLATIQGKQQYVTFDAVGLAGVDVASGKQLWSFPWKTDCDCNAATPIVMGDSVYITSGYGHGCAMVDITAEGAKGRWENKQMQAQFASPIFYKGYIYGAGDPNFLMCMDPKDGSIKWKQEGFGKGSIVGVDGTIIAMTGNTGEVVMVNLAPDAYKELGRIKPLEGDCWTAPIISNGKLIVRDKKNIACIAIK